MKIPVCLGFDASNSWIGVGVVIIGAVPPRELRGRVVGFRSFRVTDGYRAIIEHVGPYVESVAAGYTIAGACIERAAAGARDDMGPRNQAVVGDAIGWAGGTIAGYLLAKYGIQSARESSIEWRHTMSRLSAPAGYVVVPPPRPGGPKPALSSPGLTPGVLRVSRATEAHVKAGIVTRAEGYIIAWKLCEHLTPAKDLAAIAAFDGTCPTCTAPPPPTPKDGEERTRWWKRQAVDAAHNLRPDIVDAIVEAAQGRARKPRAHGSEYEGVSDACEGLWLAFHGAELVSGRVTP